MSYLPSFFVEQLYKCPNELVLLGLFLIVSGSLLLFFYVFGRLGLYVYSVLAVIIANIQVLKGAEFVFFSQPIPLGTTVFAMTFFCSDLLTEHFGAQAARRAVMLSFAAVAFVMLVMVVTLGFNPVAEGRAGEYRHFNQAHEAISILFLPAPAIFLASVIAFIISQYTDIWLFQFMKIFTKNRWLWLRTNVSTILSAFLDTLVFSVMAWMVLARESLPWSQVWESYIIGTLAMRAVLSFLLTPVMYWATAIERRRQKLNV